MKLSLAWFIGFAPIDNPKVAVAVLVEGSFLKTTFKVD